MTPSENWSRTESVTRVQTTAVDVPDDQSTATQSRWSGVVQTVPMLVPVVLVNGFAVYGQAGWALEHLSGHLAVAVLFAVALESTAVYLAWEAHSSLMAGDAALKLRVASYLVAGLVGALNYSHWSANWAPSAKAVVFAGFSVVSPWLWSVRSRSMRRADLRVQGLIDPRSVRFSTARWTLYPLRTFRAFRGAVWDGTVDPAEAIRALDQSRRLQVVQTDTVARSVEVQVTSSERPEPPRLDEVACEVQTTSPDLVRTTPSDLAQTTFQERGRTRRRKAIEGSPKPGRRDARTMPELMEEIRTAVASGDLPGDLSVAGAMRVLRVGAPKAKAVVEAFTSRAASE